MFSARKSGSPAGGYNIANSLRFQSASSTSLNRTPASAGNQTTWTWSGWVKRGTLGAEQTIFSAGLVSPDKRCELYFNSTDALVLYTNSGTGSTDGDVAKQITTSQVFRDPSAWYHIVAVIDTTQATASNRLKLYVSGSQVTALSSSAYPSQNHVTAANGTNVHYHGRWVGPTLYYLDGYLAEVNFIDGQALTPSSFGETNATTGQWIAKKYNGTYGTNGFYLPFSNGTSTTTLGADSSGNGNNWTLTNFTRSAGVSDCWMIDVPSGNGSSVGGTQPNSNYCVINPLDKATNTTLSEANLKVTTNTAAWNGVRGSFGISSGKWYFEAFIASANIALNGISIGVAQANSILTTATLSSLATSSKWIYNNTQNNTSAGGQKANGSLINYGASYTTNDVIGVAIDIDAGSIEFYKNGTSQGVAFSSQAFGQVFPFIAVWSTDAVVANFGQRSFAYTPPSGFKALCTANLD